MKKIRSDARWPSRIHPLLWLLALVPIFLGGCKSQPANYTKVKTAVTNMVVVLPPGSTFITTSNPLAITMTNPISISVTNTGMGAEKPSYDGHDDKPGDTNGCESWRRLWFGFLDHHFEEIVGILTSLIGFFGGKKMISGEIPERILSKESQAIFARFLYIIAIASLVLVIAHLFLGVIQTGVNNRASTQLTSPDLNSLEGMLAKQGTQIAGIQEAMQHTKQTVAGTGGPAATNSKSDGVPAEVTAAIIAAVFTVVVFFWRKSSEKRSVNMAVLAEIQRLREVADAHKKWWDACMTKDDVDNILIPFSHPVYSKQAKNIGMLNKSIVAKAVKFYGWVDFLNAFQATRPKYIAARGEKREEFNRLYAKLLEDFLDVFKDDFEEDFKKLACRGTKSSRQTPDATAKMKQ